MIFAIANQKGGVGKTTTAAALAVHLQRMGNRVLAVDMDPQSNLTRAFRMDEAQATLFAIFCEPDDVEFVSQVDVRDIIVEHESGVHVLPGSINLSHLQSSLNARLDRDQILARALSPIRALYDVIIIDSPPSLGAFSYNALMAADVVIAPIQCEPMALEGLALLFDTLAGVRMFKEDYRFGGAVLTMYDQRRNVDKRVASALREALDGDAFETIIPRDVRLVEAIESGDLDMLMGTSSGAVAYEQLAKEVQYKWLAVNPRPSKS